LKPVVQDGLPSGTHIPGIATEMSRSNAGVGCTLPVSMPVSKGRARARSVLSRFSVLALAGAIACQGETAGDDGENQQDVSLLDLPARVIVSEGLGEDGLEFNTSELRVRRDLTMLFSVTYQPGDFDWRTQDLADERSDVLFAFDYGSGIVRELFVAPADDRLIVPLPLLVDQERLYTSTIAPDANAIRITELDLTTGVPLARGEVSAVWELCQAVAGDDYYFDSGGELRVARDVTATALVSDLETVGSAEELCPSAGFGSLDGRLVVLEAPTASDASHDTIALWAVGEGGRDSSPLVSVQVSQVSLGTEGERAPVVAIADDGLYILASDFVSIAIWFVPYARRPGEPGVAAGTTAPTPVSRMEIPFFAGVVPFEGSAISFDTIAGFAAIDRVLAASIRLLEEAGGQRFFWNALVIVDLEANRADLLELGFSRLSDFSLVRSPLL
jgi:hypothetical protein